MLLDGSSLQVVGSGVVDQGVEQDLLARQLLEAVTAGHGLHRDDVQTIVATGYGRKLIRDADATITEITCQAAGVAHVAPERGRSSTSVDRTASCFAWQPTAV